MKILTVNNTADIYGASRCLERVFSRLAEAGHEVHAVLPEHGPLADLLSARGVVVHFHPRLAVIDRGKLRSIGGIFRFLFHLPVSAVFIMQLILRLKIDLVHTNTVVMPSPSLAAMLTGRPHVWHIRELLHEFGALWHPYQRWIYYQSSAIIAMSSCIRDQFETKFQRKVEVIYDGLDHSTGLPDPSAVAAFRALFPADALLVGVVGRIKWHRKGQEVLVRAASMLRTRFPNAYYPLVGSASPGNEDQVTRLRALIREHDLDEVVVLVGEIDDSASVFAALDIAVAPPIQPEPFGCVVIEAMAVGTPVVGSRAGGIAEQIVDGHSGLLFAPGDAEELARALAYLLEDESARKRMAEEGLLRVRTTFPLGQTCKATSALFERLVPQGTLPCENLTAH